ncbi:hypothetical protein [[Curtobacterium] plantarum]|jgi:hypothetical protein|uniref:hypothetical protein n=1 Tax=[Curtobacterium] plantarum TaxID=221276 RepID=UPI000F077DB6|nr:hypothetical protein [[Curtobacterium] plantarum]RNA78757.1 hypothetical protein EBO33_01670 [[Curtobacterium] plantarum]
MSWASFIGVLKDIVVVVAPATGAIVAVKGLGTWKRQLKGQSDYNLAKEVLINLFKYRDALYFVRNPLMTEQELKLPEGKDPAEMNFSESRYLRTLTAYQNRWDNVLDNRAKLQTNIIEMEVLWGEEFTSQLMSLFRKEQDLLFQVEYYLRLVNPAIHGDDKKFERDNLDRKMLYDTMKDDTDKFRISFKETLDPLQNSLRDKLKK